MKRSSKKEGGVEEKTGLEEERRVEKRRS